MKKIEKENIKKRLADKVDFIQTKDVITRKQIKRAYDFIHNDQWALLTQSPESIRVNLGDNGNTDIVEIAFNDDDIYPKKGKKQGEWNEYSYAALLLCQDNISWMKDSLTGKKYTRAGMIERVLHERQEKAGNANYKVKLAGNLYGPHTLINDTGQTYQITLWDFDAQTGYIDNIDWRTNKLATTKHIMYLYNYLKKHPRKTKKLKNVYPFVDITLDPLNDYKISWFYPSKLDKSSQKLIDKYFGNKKVIEDHQIPRILTFMQECQDMDHIRIRPEVLEKVDRYFNEMSTRETYNSSALDYSFLKADLFAYQKEGVEFALPKTGAIIADEMGLGKTIQAITIAVLKKRLYDFQKTLIICPASIKHQWKSEIEKFTDESATIIEGFPHERAEKYLETDAYFFIINYETVLRDLVAINDADFDFVILDEAQRIKNFNTKTANAIKGIKKQHGLVITGTPIENKLVDLYSVVQFVDPYMLTPLWEFSYQHCIFHPDSKNRITGYYNLSELKKRLEQIVLRREKRKVLDQLPNISQKNIFVKLHPEQQRLHTSAAVGVAKILAKKFKTPYDWQRLMLLLTTMRMACDSSYLVDKQTFHSTKLIELKHILINQLNLKDNNRKVIIFSEWITMQHMIGDALKEIDLGYVMLTGKVPVKKRAALITEFEENPECRIFLSTEAGGSGLNLQMADVVINYELPWNPAKKNQRIGRIDRLGQKSNKLTVINLITVGTIESKIATGLLLKQNLFDGVLNEGVDIDKVDFSEKGRSQFIKQLEEMMDSFESDEFDSDTSSEDETYGDQQDDILDNTLDDDTSANENMTPSKEEKFEQLEGVLNKGMEFLSGIYKMSSGQDLNVKDDQAIKVNKETGEVTMTFKVKF